MRLLVLLHEAFGGRGGIAKFNRDLLNSLCAHPDVSEVLAIPRLVVDPPGPMPAKLRYPVSGITGKAGWFARVAQAGLSRPRFDLILCGHINLLPAAFAVRPVQATPLGLIVHGIDAWRPTGRRLTDHLARQINFFIAVSACTKSRFLSWTEIDERRGYILPNAVDTEHFKPAPPNSALRQRWGLAGKRVILTLARLDARERYKGIDEILDILPSLIGEIPNLAYVVAGDGSDRVRLQAKAQALGVADHVVFTGYLLESEKPDLYRLADVFAMPSHGEGFGIVFLEAMACGTPVVASAVDGGREAVCDGALGILVNPTDPDDIRAGIRKALNRPRGVPEGLSYFDLHHFQGRVHAILDQVRATTAPSLALRRR